MLVQSNKIQKKPQLANIETSIKYKCYKINNEKEYFRSITQP